MTKTSNVQRVVPMERLDAALETIGRMIREGKLAEAVGASQAKLLELAACWGEGRNFTHKHYLEAFRAMGDAAARRIARGR